MLSTIVNLACLESWNGTKPGANIHLEAGSTLTESPASTRVKWILMVGYIKAEHHPCKRGPFNRLGE